LSRIVESHGRLHTQDVGGKCERQGFVYQKRL